MQCFKYIFISHQPLWIWILEITGLAYIYLTYSSYKANCFCLCEERRFVCKETVHVSTRISFLSKPHSVNILQDGKSWRQADVSLLADLGTASSSPAWIHWQGACQQQQHSRKPFFAYMTKGRSFTLKSHYWCSHWRWFFLSHEQPAVKFCHSRS